MKNFIFLAVCVCLLAACKTQEASQVSVADDFLLRITRTPCYGTCPDFTMTVDANGNVAYTGRNFVDNLGMYSKRISRKQVKQLVQILEEGKFWEYNEVYDNQGVTDLPSIITECTHNGKSRQVLNRIGAPKELGEMQVKLEEVIGEDGYKTILKREN